MERVALERFLAEGLSLAEIGRRVGRHESTVAYWMGKHGLEATDRGKHLPKGALERDELEALVQQGLSISQIALASRRSKATVRHWLREYGLQTRWAERRQGPRDGRRELILTCAHHRLTTFRLRMDAGYRCAKCNSDAVSKRRRRVKQILVEEAGGACCLCGYDRCLAALEFHHLDPEEKRFQMSARFARSLARVRAEARKCVLLCSNCHAEAEAGVAVLPPGREGS